jgi:hypothetical protein
MFLVNLQTERFKHRRIELGASVKVQNDNPGMIEHCPPQLR